jgi:hypothetical protein
MLLYIAYKHETAERETLSGQLEAWVSVSLINKAYVTGKLMGK